MKRPASHVPFNPLDYPLCLASPRQVDALSWHEHIPFAMTLVQLLSPHVIVELGVHTGDSYLAFCQAVAEAGGQAAVYGVDTWRGDPHAGQYGQEVLDKLRSHHDPLYGSFSRLVQSTFDEAALHFADSSIDLLHIDGFHEYEAVSHDWETWKPKLSARGVVLLHDTNVRERGFGVWRLWEELTTQFSHLEFSHGHGLGVLAVGSEAAGRLHPLLAAAQQNPRILQDFFHRLGNRITFAAQIGSQVAALGELERCRDELGAAKSGLEARLAEAGTACEARSSECVELTRTVQEREAEIELLRRRGDDDQIALQARNDELTASTREQQRLLAELADNGGQIRTLQETVAALAKRAGRDADSLATERATIDSLQGQLQDQQTASARLSGKHADQEAQLAALLSSTSWRVTGPFRWMGMRLRGLVRRGFFIRIREAMLLLRHPLRLRRHLMEIRLLRTSDLFDGVYYRSQYPDVARSGVDPLMHYVLFGAFEDRNPGPFFDSRFYLEANADVARARLNPLAHYIGWGAAEGRSPHSLFDASFYRKQYPDFATSGLDPLSHYLLYGAKEGCSPHPLFDAAFYLWKYPDVARSALNPLGHYLQFGAKEGRDPHPLFDASYYIASNPDLREPNALVDYIRHGARRGQNPNPLFDPSYYCETCSDVLESGRSPLEHYVIAGWARGHSPHPLFDPLFYISRNADVAASGLDPLRHFLWFGARERRDPNPMFDTSFYVEHYPDVEAAGLNPLYHYSRFGCPEGRDPHPLFRTQLYFEENPSIRAAGVNALAHFLRSLPKEQDPRNTPFAFRSWLATYDCRESDAAGIRNHLARLGRCPSLSLILASPEDAEPSVLEATIDSVRRQLYDAWELLVILPPGIEHPVLDRMSRLSAEERRVRVLRSLTAEPWAMLNEGLASATGDFVAFVGDDDLLDERALFLFAESLCGQPEAAVVYSDEDRVDPQGRRCHPHFKPDWNRDLFFGWNYLGRLVFLDRHIVEAVGGFRGTFAPSHEYDLLLRVVGEAGDSRVRHIPWILCHRRSGSAADCGGASTPEEARSAIRAVEDHLQQGRTPGSVEPVGERFHRVLYPLPEELPLVSVIVPTRDRLNLLQPCVRSLLEKTDYPRFEILVVDNESSDPETLEYLRGLPAPHRVLKYAGEFNYSAINNFAVGQAAGSVMVLLNNDTEVVNPSWLTEMVRLVIRIDVGVVGAKLYYPDETVQHAGVVVGVNGVAGHAFAGLPRTDEGHFGRAVLTHEYSAVTGACMAMRRTVFEEVGGLDAQAFPVNFNDIDLCLRVRDRGLKVLFCAPAELVHHECASRNKATLLDDRLAGESDSFRARWMSVVRCDPFYNPNLSLVATTFSLAIPPRTRKPWDETAPASPARRVSGLDPYASLDNWQRAAEVQNAPRVSALPGRGWRPGLSIVILTLDKFELIGPLLDQLAAARLPLGQQGLEIEIIVGDTGSTDERVIRKYEDMSGQILVERDLKYHFSRCNNRLFTERVSLDRTLFLNNDIIFADATHSLLALAHQFDKDPDLGIAGAVLTYPDGRVQHAGIDFYHSGPLRGLPYHPYHGGAPELLKNLTEGRDCPAVTGACLAIRSSLLAELGGFDEAYGTEGQDVALCLATWRHGHRCRVIPAGRIDHLENGTRPKGSEDWGDRQRLRRRWGSFVEAGLC